MAWAYRDPDPDPFVHTPKMAEMSDEEPQVGNYAQLFDIHTRPLGKYKIRAVYDYDVGYTAKELAASPWYVEVKTPFIEFEVLP